MIVWIERFLVIKIKIKIKIGMDVLRFVGIHVIILLKMSERSLIKI